MSAIHERGLPSPDELGGSAEQWLEHLEGPTFVRVPGRDRTRTRAVSTLLHGNEPSGLRALHAWLAGGRTPAVDAVFLIAAVAAARRAPHFTHRMLPGGRDLNRCFVPPFAGAEGGVAGRALELLREARPEALIDLHNNTGHNPPYGVGTHAAPHMLALAALFGERFVASDLRLGSLTEALSDELPSVVIECGRAGDAHADAVARDGLERFLLAERLDALPDPTERMRVLEAPIRVCARPGLRVAFGDAPHAGADLTLAADIDRHNFEWVPARALFGWVAPGAPWPIAAHGADAKDVSQEIFSVRDGRLFTRRGGIPIMMTTDPRVALQDCLFYFTAPGSGHAPDQARPPAGRRPPGQPARSGA